MTLAELERHILSHYMAEASHPFDKDKSITVFSRTDNKKWFAATKNIGCRSVDVDRSGRIDILNVKLEPRLVTSLRGREGFRPAWNMNRNNWVTILLDGTVPDAEIYGYLDQAFADAGASKRR